MPAIVLAMLTLEEVGRISMNAASVALQGAELSAVFGEPTFDSLGKDALVVTIVIRSGVEKISGDAAIDAFVRIQRDLSEAGEERFPIIEFATEEEMSLTDDDG